MELARLYETLAGPPPRDVRPKAEGGPAQSTWTELPPVYALDVQLIATKDSELTKARLEGLDAVRASVLDDQPEESRGIMLIATPNDEFNTLAAMRAVEFHDREHVYQLAPSRGSDLGTTRPRARLLVSPTFSFVTASQGMLSGLLAQPFGKPDGGLAHHPVDPGAPDGG